MPTTRNTTRKPATKNDYWQATVNAVSANDWLKIINKAKEQAFEGDNNARKFLSEILLKSGVDPARLKPLWKALVEEAMQDDNNSA